jgi:hypothetical protein
MQAAIAAVAPNAASAKMANGWVAQGRPLTMIADIADMLNLRWWYKDGQISFVARDAALPDFAIAFDTRTNVLSVSEPSSLSNFEHQFREFTAILTPLAHPGRVVFLRLKDGTEVRGRVLEASYVGDTHGDDWTVTVLIDDTAQQELPSLLPY